MDLTTVIAAIDERIAKLTQAREVLVSEFPAPSTAPTKVTTPAASAVRQPRPPSALEALDASHPQRKIAQALRDGARASATDLASLLKLEKSTVLYHLTAMREARLVTTEGAGRATRWLLQ